MCCINEGCKFFAILLIIWYSLWPLTLHLGCPPDTGDLLLLIERGRNDTGAFSDLDLGRSYSFHLEACTTIPDTLMERKAQPTLTSSYHRR